MRNISNKRKVKWLKKNCAGDGYGNLGKNVVNLSGLDFGNMLLDFSGVKAKVINNSEQESQRIYNSRMKAEFIVNEHQEAIITIYNNHQQAGRSILNTNKKEEENSMTINRIGEIQSYRKDLRMEIKKSNSNIKKLTEHLLHHEEKLRKLGIPKCRDITNMDTYEYRKYEEDILELGLRLDYRERRSLRLKIKEKENEK